MKQTFTAEYEGFTFKRTSETRTYSHVVIYRIKIAAGEPMSWIVKAGE